MADQDQFDSADQSGQTHNPQINPAADLIRTRIDQLYDSEPSFETEAQDLTMAGGRSLSTHQKFMLELKNSGKSEEEIQIAWHDYYHGLSDSQKHAVWQEFYSVHAAASKALNQPAIVGPEHYHQPSKLSKLKSKLPTPQKTSEVAKKALPESLSTVKEVKQKIHAQLSPEQKLSRWQHIKSALFGLGVGLAVIVVLLFGFFNERVITPFITPSKSVSNTPIISQSTQAVGPEPEIIIPKINLEVPVVYGETSTDEKKVQKALEQGVLHYGGTPKPGQTGNVVIVGHSSNNIFNKGRYKFAFVLLNRLESEDLVMLNEGGKRYTYKVVEKKVVKPSEVSVLQSQNSQAKLTLITCDPPGTALNRLIVVAEQVSPDPASNLAATPSAEVQAPSIPGNAPSLWSRLTGWL